jgi:hypothetical protein
MFGEHTQLFSYLFFQFYELGDQCLLPVSCRPFQMGLTTGDLMDNQVLCQAKGPFFLDEAGLPSGDGINFAKSISHRPQ